MEIRWHPEARAEYHRLPAREQAAMQAATEKLETDPLLGFPHTSSVGAGLRELRPRQGRSAWRGLYARVGDLLVLLAVGPEAQHDRRGFDRAVKVARDRLDTLET